MCESTCDREIEAQLERFEDRSDGAHPAPNGKERNQGNAPGHVPELEKVQMGAPKAATAHKLAKLVYSMLRYGQGYVDAGAEYYESQYHHRALRAAKRRVDQLGYQLVPTSNAQDQVPGVPLNPAAAS